MRITFHDILIKALYLCISALPRKKLQELFIHEFMLQHHHRQTHQAQLKQIPTSHPGIRQN